MNISVGYIIVKSYILFCKSYLLLIEELMLVWEIIKYSDKLTVKSGGP